MHAIIYADRLSTAEAQLHKSIYGGTEGSGPPPQFLDREVPRVQIFATHLLYTNTVRK